MTYTFKVIFFALGSFIGFILAIALKHNEILPKEFDGRWIGVGLAIGGLILGHYIDNKLECARIARELDADRMRMESDASNSIARKS